MLTAFILLSAVTIAQSNKEDIAIVQNMFGKDKKELVQAYMTIPEAKKQGSGQCMTNMKKAVKNSAAKGSQ